MGTLYLRIKSKYTQDPPNAVRFSYATKVAFSGVTKSGRVWRKVL